VLPKGSADGRIEGRPSPPLDGIGEAEWKGTAVKFRRQEREAAPAIEEARLLRNQEARLLRNDRDYLSVNQTQCGCGRALSSCPDCWGGAMCGHSAPRARCYQCALDTPPAEGTPLALYTNGQIRVAYYDQGLWENHPQVQHSKSIMLQQLQTIEDTGPGTVLPSWLRAFALPGTVQDEGADGGENQELPLAEVVRNPSWANVVPNPAEPAARNASGGNIPWSAQVCARTMHHTHRANCNYRTRRITGGRDPAQAGAGERGPEVAQHRRVCAWEGGQAVPRKVTAREPP
jgi:hypothetical protein